MTAKRAIPKKLLSRRSLLLTAPALMIPATALGALRPTPRATEGPFYPVRLPRDDDADLVRVEGAIREAGGDVLLLFGRVLDVNARPMGGVRVEIWQCDLNGIYLHPGDRRLGRRDAAFQGFGHADTDAAGRFSFRTIVPVPYTGRTPHIHVKVRAGGRELITTQLYRAGYPQNASDFLFGRLTPEEQDRVSMVIKPHSGAARPTFETEIDIVVA
jgi:protocatechuate 3,4-dioxygenase beta subunit